MYRKILLPTDGSKFADDAADQALWLASVSGAEIIVLSVIETNFVVGLPAVETTESITNMLKKEAERNIKKVTDKAIKEEYEIKITSMIEEGSPSKKILEISEEIDDIDLIVLGTSGKSGFDRFILGSVANNVVRSAKCTVLVVN